MALRDALDSFHIRGVGHNINFLSALLKKPRFASGKLSTNFIAEEFPDGFGGTKPEIADIRLINAVAAVVHADGRVADAEIEVMRGMARAMGLDGGAVDEVGGCVGEADRVRVRLAACRNPL